jgi:alkyldihydroxyacetonephosphate synthase
VAESMRGTWRGETLARRWLDHRYAVSYRQAPLFAKGVFVDTMEVAARWSDIGRLYDGVRRALGRHVFVMAHFSHAYPDGCCIYFSFAGSADAKLASTLGWDAACAATYDRAWKAALDAASAAGGTFAHHHGVGRSKAPRLSAELGEGVAVVRGLMRAFDPGGILNPGNLVPESTSATPLATAPPARALSARASEGRAGVEIDHVSLLALVEGTLDLSATERLLNESGLTLDVLVPRPAPQVAQWLAAGAPGARDRWRDPVDQLVAGFEATLPDGRELSVLPAPRRSVGPDLTTLFVGAGGRFGRIDRAWLRVHRRGASRPSAAAFDHEREPAPNDGEQALLDAVARSLGNR